jgi:uncharacterized protein (DUF1697 family)
VERGERVAIHIGLLRAVNVGGRNRGAMSDLRALLHSLGMTDVRSLLQSGNVVFRSEVSTPEQLEDLVQQAAEKQLALQSACIVRTADEWQAVVAENPFQDDARRDPGHLLVVFLKKAPKTSDVTALRKAMTGGETIRVKGRHAYVVYPDSIGRSRLTTRLLEEALGTGTGRNWNTVMKLGTLAETL